ncbi:major facilitator superfamily domain-containing protein [Schizophyllum amplum]|uniref:Major facilitator superfamily domain-containing protein n=1 Tax=Schizophyllum amplum TaxID=97359 RepID=A0A550CKS6_9AGAR|nr:major facilitator superfamily domain-containing protein [Auriculariopsis ampla]
MACLSFLVVALNSGGQTASWGSPLLIGLLVVVGVSGAAFWVIEKYARMPIAPTRLFVHWQWRNVPLMLINRTLLFFHNFALIFYVPIFLQVIGLDTLKASALIIPFLFMASVSSTFANELTSKYGYIRLAMVCGLVVLPIGMGLMSSLRESSSVSRIVGYSLVSGFGFGAGTQLMLVMAQVGLPADELSTVTALVGAAPTLGGVLGVAVMGSVINTAFQANLDSSPVLANSTIPLNANDVVTTLSRFSQHDPARDAVVSAYVSSWQRGCYLLVGVAGLQILLCCLVRQVEFDSHGKRDALMNEVRVQ